MNQRTDLAALPPELAKEIGETEFLAMHYLAVMSFLITDAKRDPDYFSTHLLSCLSQDILQSAVSLSLLVREGILNVARRELRFLLEASVKIAAIQQRSYITSIEEKLDAFKDEFSSSSVTIKKDIELSLLPEAYRAPFLEEVGRLYGLTSKYVHLSPTQIANSLAAFKAGATAGKERPIDVNEFNRLAERALAASLVLLFHGVPYWVAGDWLVDIDGASTGGYFMRSRFVAAMDEGFDYKAERKAILADVQSARSAGIKF